MPDSPYGFNAKDVKRIATTVRKAESVESLGSPTSSHIDTAPVFITARITGEDAGKFSWQQARRTNWIDETAESGWEVITDGLFGTTTVRYALSLAPLSTSKWINHYVTLMRLPYKVFLGDPETEPDNYVIEHSFFIMPQQTDEVLYIAGNRGKKEVYKANIVSFNSDVFDTSSGTFSFSQIGGAGAEVTAINAQEGDGSNSHYLTATPQRLRLVIGRLLPCLDDAGRFCYLIINKDFEVDCGTA